MSLRKAAKKAAKTAAGTAANALSVASETAATVGGKAVEAASCGASKVVDNAQKKRHISRLAKYNPVFPNEFFAPDYDLPNVIVIADGDERKGIDVCEGALGWLTRHEGMEIPSLIESRRTKSNRTNDYSLKLDSTSSSAMTMTTAAKIDAGLKVAKVKTTSSFTNTTEQESRRKLIFHVKF